METCFDDRAKRALYAFLVGVALVGLTRYITKLSGSFVILSEMWHAGGDTVGIGILFLAIYFRKEGSGPVGFIGMFMLALAGGFAAISSIVEGLNLFSQLDFGQHGGITVPVGLQLREPFWMLVGSSTALSLTFIQYRLLGSMHHMLHGDDCSHTKVQRGEVHSFWGSDVLKQRKGGTLQKKDSAVFRAALTETFLDMLQAAIGVALSAIAFYYIEHTLLVKWGDILSAALLGGWMIERGLRGMMRVLKD